MSTSTLPRLLPMREVLTGLARPPRANLFRHVTHADECGAPVVDPDAPDMGLCENDMPLDTVVTVVDRDGQQITRCTLKLALRHGPSLQRIGARTFTLSRTADRYRGPGLTPTQARRAHLAKVNGS